MENYNHKKRFGLKEDTTKYGEFVSSYFGWIPLDKQKERADDLEEVTKKEEKEEKE